MSNIKTIAKVMSAIGNADKDFTWLSEDAFDAAKMFIELVEDNSPEDVIDFLISKKDEDKYDDEEKLLLEDEEDEEDEDDYETYGTDSIYEYCNDYETRVFNRSGKRVTVPKTLMKRLEEEYPEAKQFFMYEDPYAEEFDFFILPALWHLDDETKKILSPKKLKLKKLHAGKPLESHFTVKVRPDGTTVLHVKKDGIEEYGVPYNADFSFDEDVRGIKVQFNN